MLRMIVALTVTALIAVGVFVAFNQPSVATTPGSETAATAEVCACGDCESGCQCCSSDSVSCEDCVCKTCGCEVCKDKSGDQVAACACGDCESSCKCCSSDSVTCEDCVCKACGCETCADKS